MEVEKFVLWKGNDTRRVGPFTFRSCKFEATKINNDIHDKEVLPIVDCFERWCHLWKVLLIKSLSTMITRTDIFP